MNIRIEVYNNLYDVIEIDDGHSLIVESGNYGNEPGAVWENHRVANNIAGGRWKLVGHLCVDNPFNKVVGGI